MTERKKRGCLRIVGDAVLGLFGLLVALAIVGHLTTTPEERAEREALAEAQRAERERQEAAEEAEIERQRADLAKRREEERAERERREAEERAERERQRAAEEVEKKRKGFHCLSPWDGSHRDLVEQLKRQLNDPSSFEHAETRVTPVDENGEHRLVMEYRARNAFGTLILQRLSATYRNSDCEVVTWNAL